MTDRAARRREALEAAGLELLAERGWPGVTARALAERSGTNAGLIHYYYGGLPQLHRAVAARAVRASIRPLVEQLTVADDVCGGVIGAIEAAADNDSMRLIGRLTSELVVGAFRDEDTRVLVRAELRRARADLETWVARLEPDWNPRQVSGVVIIVTALLDGLVLQHLVDDDLDLRGAAEGLARVVGRQA